MSGRDFVLPDDVKALVHTTLSHRVILGPAHALPRPQCRPDLAGCPGKSCRSRGRSERLGQYEHVTAGDNYPAGVEFDSRSNYRGKTVLPVKLSLGFLVAWELDLVPLFHPGFKTKPLRKGFTCPGRANF